MASMWSRKSKKAQIEIPGNAPDKRLSAIYSAYQQAGTPTPYLLNIGLEAAKLANEINLSDISYRIKEKEINYIDIFPGEHYKLLSALTKILQPKLVIELGTHLGYSSLCFKQFLPADGKVVTFDVIPWNEFDATILQPADFDHQLQQKIADVTDPVQFEKFIPLFEKADLIFMDALKDGIQEYRFLENFRKMNFQHKCLFVFDDIRLWNMLDIWYNMSKPKLDLTSFGHWSGTGLVEWN